MAEHGYGGTGTGYRGVIGKVCRGAVCKSAAQWAKEAAEKKKEKKGTDTSMYRRTNSGRYG